MNLCEIAKIGEIMDMRVGNIVARAKIERLLGSDGFVIGYPTYKLVPLALCQDEPYDFWFLREDGVFNFTAVLKNEYVVEDLRFCALKLITPVLRQQRREAFRIRVYLNATIRFLDDKTQQMKNIPVKTIDLSQRGVLFRAYHSIKMGERFLFCVDLSDNETLCVDATAIRVTQADQKQGEYHVAAQFHWEAHYDQSILYRFILQKQILYRKAKKDDGYKR